jgi:Domain of unknown function (DUF4340)
MKLRTFAIAVTVLAALSVFAYLGNRTKQAPSTDPRVGTVVLDSDTAAKAAGLVVADQGKEVDLARGADGTWTVASYFNFPADFSKVSQLAQDLNEAKVERLVTENPDRMAHLGFKDSAITLKDASGKEIWRLVVGKEPDSGTGRFIRFGDEPRAYFSGMHIWLDTDSKGWANAQLLSVKPEDIASIEIPFDEGKSVVVSRAKKDAPWTSESTTAGKQVSADKIASVLASLTALKFTDTTDVGDAAALAAAPHMTTYKLTTFDGKSLAISMGRKPEEKKLKAPTTDAKAGLAALGNLTDTKAPVKPTVPEFDTIPAGPVFVAIASSDSHAGINELMKKRAFEIDDYVFTGLPQKPDELFESAKGK